MSLKLGNTDIAGTQILYSTTGNNTDGAMTQATTTTELGLKANDANVVHKTGNETINGIKTFNNAIHFNNSVFVDFAAGDEGGEIELAKAPNSSLTSNVKLDVYKNCMRIYGSASNNTIREIITADIENNNLRAPASDANNSVVTTVAKSKAASGYFKLGNGLIIQWGEVTVTSVPHTVNLSTAMSSYKVVATPYGTTGNNREICITGQTTTTFSAAVVNATKFFWIAIGY